MTLGLVHATIVAMLTAGAGQPTLNTSSDLFSTQVATVLVPSAELHADASSLQPVVDRLSHGEEAIVIFVNGDWLKVRGSEEREGWLERSSTTTRFENLDKAQIRTGELVAQR